MSLKCSILGHRFDETAVERDRQEDGSEVVTTITELETCTRCGETRVVSENKEVRTLETPEGAGSEVAGGDAAGAKTAMGTDTTDESPGGAESADAVADEAGVEDPTDPAADDGEILGAGGDDGDASDAGSVAAGDADAAADTGTADEAGSVDAGAGAADPGEDEAATDDAVIIDGDTGTERDPGEWPDDAESDADEAGSDSGAGAGTADAGSADPGEENWPPASSDEDDTAGASGDAAWPEETRRDTDDAAESPLEESASPTVTVPEGMYKCPECGFTDEVESSSLRAGDFCPECHRGTLVQDEDSSD